MLLADRSYDVDAMRAKITLTGTRAVISARRGRRSPGLHSKPHYTWRNRIERVFNKIKNSRRIAIRYNKTAVPIPRLRLNRLNLPLDQLCPRNLAKLRRLRFGCSSSKLDTTSIQLELANEDLERIGVLPGNRPPFLRKFGENWKRSRSMNSS